ncbi:hypothetical protein GCM10010381_32860 [Streptomyces xantholiticus]|nr:hypothetical protein GCM10010381_32860 [Streptomyces xantholiticus]
MAGCAPGPQHDEPDEDGRREGDEDGGDDPAKVLGDWRGGPMTVHMTVGLAVRFWGLRR